MLWNNNVIIAAMRGLILTRLKLASGYRYTVKNSPKKISIKKWPTLHAHCKKPNTFFIEYRCTVQINRNFLRVLRSRSWVVVVEGGLRCIPRIFRSKLLEPALYLFIYIRARASNHKNTREIMLQTVV